MSNLASSLPPTTELTPPSEWSYIERRHRNVGGQLDVREYEDVTHYITPPEEDETTPGFFNAWQIDGGKKVALHRSQVIKQGESK